MSSTLRLCLSPLLLLPLLAAPVHAQIVDRVVPQHILDQIAADHDDGTVPLPKYTTEEELRLWEAAGRVAHPIGPTNAPQGERIDTPPEYALNEAIMMRWTGGTFGYAALQTEMIVAITTLDERARVDLFVTNASQQSAVINSLSQAGADLSRVSFHFQNAAGSSIWMRDYGPRFVNVDSERAIVDHTYNRPRPGDNMVPGAVSNLWDVPLYLLPLCHGGGNYHSFANGEAFMTDLIVRENDGSVLVNACQGLDDVNEQQVKNLYAGYQGVDLTVTDPLPQEFDSTQHIDMWTLPVADNVMMVNEYPNTAAYEVPYAVSEATASDLLARGYTVYRVPARSIGPTHFTYVNSVIVNNIVLACQFFNNGTVNGLNAQALSVFEQAFPDKLIVPVDCSGIIPQSGAIHCIVMHVPFADRIYRGRFDD